MVKKSSGTGKDFYQYRHDSSVKSGQLLLAFFMPGIGFCVIHPAPDNAVKSVLFQAHKG